MSFEAMASSILILHILFSLFKTVLYHLLNHAFKGEEETIQCLVPFLVQLLHVFSTGERNILCLLTISLLITNILVVLHTTYPQGSNSFLHLLDLSSNIRAFSFNFVEVPA